jgi:hypothetical protein
LTREQAIAMVSKEIYEWKRVTLVMRLVKKVVVKLIIKIKFFSVSEKEVRMVVESQGVKIVEIRELRTGGLRSGRWLVIANERITSIKTEGIHYEVERSEEELREERRRRMELEIMKRDRADLFFENIIKEEKEGKELKEENIEMKDKMIMEKKMSKDLREEGGRKEKGDEKEKGDTLDEESDGESDGESDEKSDGK